MKPFYSLDCVNKAASLFLCADSIKDGLSSAGSAVAGAAGKVVDVTKTAAVKTGEGISTVAHKATDAVGREPLLYTIYCTCIVTRSFSPC